MPLFGYVCRGAMLPGGRLTAAELGAVEAGIPASITSPLSVCYLDLESSCDDLPWTWTQRLLFESPHVDPYDQQPVLRIFELPDGFGLCCHRIADFQLKPGGLLRYRLHRPEWGYLAEICLLGTVMAFVLEADAHLALHASALVPPGHDTAVGFLAAQGSGKSVLAASWALRGARLLSDDIVAVELATASVGGTVRPSYPRLRLWPEGARGLGLEGAPDQGTGAGSAQLLRPDSEKLLIDAGPHGLDIFDANLAPLRCLYVPQRLDDSSESIQIEPLAPREALFELLRCSFLPPDLLAAVGFQAARLDLLARLVRDVPVKRLSYPSGYQHLPRVHDTVLSDLC